jgi:hypothetical protein
VPTTATEEGEGVPEYTRGRTAPFTTVPHQLLRDPKADSYTIAVYCAIRAHADHRTGQGAFPSDERLALWAGCSVRTVQYRRQELRRMGWLEWESGKEEGATNRYVVHDMLEPEEGCAPGAEGVRTTCVPGYAPGADNRESIDREPGTEKDGSPDGDHVGAADGADEEDPAEWMHEVWQEVLGSSRRRLTLTRARRQKYRAMYREQLAEAPEPEVAWRAVLFAVTRSTHHMSQRAFQMPESLLRNAERRDSWVESAILALEGRSNSKADQQARRRREDLLQHLRQRRKKP